MPNSLELTLFGSPEVRSNGHVVTGFRTGKAQALLYYLAVTGRPHTRVTLAGLLWGDQPEAAARASLSKCLSNLHDLLGEAVLVERQTAAFNHNCPYQLDTEHFLASVGAPPTAETLPRVQAALALYRGDFLEGFYVREAPEFEQWLLTQRAHYREAMVNGLYGLATYAEQQGDLTQAITHCRRLLMLEPWREEAHRQLMSLLARTGQRAAALAQFETCRRVLAEELAVEPDAETLALVEAIRADKMTRWQDDKMTVASPHLATLSPPHPVTPPLPLPPTPLIGRERDLADLGEWIGNPQCKLITITGPGGIGKTRLALAAAADHSAKFQHGAVFVPLAGVSSAQFLPQAILSALNVPFRGDLSPQQQVRALLSSQERLLVLDNYEHLLPDVELLIDLLHYAPKTMLLVTSRERLALQAEHLHELAGLDYPPSPATSFGANASRNWIGYAAVQLFLQRVRQTHLRFTPNEEEMAAIVRICRISEGMPLALELTATLIRDRPLVEIAHQLEQGSRLEATRLRGLPDRHRSMWTVFDYSWHLLSPEEQHVFCGLSVFRGGFQAEAAQAVVKSAPELLAALVDKSLLRYQSGSPASGRYHIHELLRQYANQRLAETGLHETILSGHSAYFLHLAEKAEPELYGAQQKSWLDRLTLEHDNLRAALGRCLLKDPEMALQLASALSEFWFLGGYFNEGRNWLGQALSRTSADRTVTRGSALTGAGRLAWIQGDFEQATSLATEGLNLFRLLDNPQHIAAALNLLGNIQLFQNELNQARSFFEQALVLRRQVGNQAAIARTVINLGLVAMYEDNFPQAKSLLEESLAVSQLTKDQIFSAICLANLGYMEVYFGNLSEATPYLRDAILVGLSHGDQETVVLCLEGFAEIAAAALDNQNSLQTAACLFGTAETFRHRLAIPLPPMDRPFYESSLAALRAHMNEAAFATAWARGAAMSLEQAVAYALADPALPLPAPA